MIDGKLHRNGCALCGKALADDEGFSVLKNGVSPRDASLKESWLRACDECQKEAQRLVRKFIQERRT